MVWPDELTADPGDVGGCGAPAVLAVALGHLEPLEVCEACADRLVKAGHLAGLPVSITAAATSPAPLAT